MRNTIVALLLLLSNCLSANWDSLYTEIFNYYQQRDYSKALNLIYGIENESLSIYEKSATYNITGMILFDKGFYRESIQYYHKSYQEFNNPVPFINLSFAYIKLGEIDSAELFHQKSILNQSEQEVFRYTVLFAKNLRDHNLTQAYSIIKNLTPPDSSPVLDRYYLIKGEYEKSVPVLELALQYSSSDYMSAQILEAMGDVDLAGSINYYTAAVIKLDSVMILADNYPARLEAAMQQQGIFNKLIIGAELDEEIFFWTERSRSAALRLQLIEQGNLNRESAIKTIIEISAELGKNDVLISYKSSLDGQLYITAIYNNNYKMLKVPLDSSLISEFRNQLASQNKPGNSLDKFAQVSHKLYNSFLGDIPLKKNIIIVPDESLYGIPFDALLTENAIAENYSDLPYLIKKHTVRYLYTASLNGQTEFANNKFKHVIAENNQLAKLSVPYIVSDKLKSRGGYSVNYTVGTDSINRIMENQAITHIDAHGIINQDSSLYSYIQLTNEKLYVKDIINLQLNNNLVTVTSCNSAAGAFMPGEGIVSAERAFIYAGADAVISSLWLANERYIEFLFPDLYANIEKGMPIEKAMQKAKIKMLSEQRIGTQPFYWANFVVIGKKVSPAKRPGSGVVAFAVCIGIGLLLLLLIRRRRAR